MMRRLTTSYVRNQIYKLGKHEYKLCKGAKYHRAIDNLPIKHLKCGHIFHMSWHAFKRGERCPYCQGGSRLPLSYIKHQTIKLTHGQYVCKAQTYKNAQQKLIFKHLKCGYVFSMRWNDFQSGERCPKCNGQILLTIPLLKKRIKFLGKGQYVLLSKHYKDESSKLLFKHLKCGKVFPMTWEHFQNGERCPHCASSRGEKIVDEYLTKHGVKFIHGYQTKACFKPHHYLHLDFYLPHFRIGIEYDGYQHQYPVKFMGGDKGLSIRCKRDNYKDRWCAKHDIILLRIKNYRAYFTKKSLNTIKQYLNSVLGILCKLRS